ncbi:hypothetical protein V8F33_009536 [Rhypophila sp. PSN 637]
MSIAPSILRGVPETAAASKSQQDSCCFLCSRVFANRSCLTRHFRDAHLIDSAFYKPLAAGAAEVVVHGPGQWCNYEHTHGLIHTPSVNPGVNPGCCMSTSRLICLLCEAPMASTSTLLAHMNRTEIPRFRNDGRVACRPCTREGRVGGEPMSIWEWLTHAGVVHKWSLSHEPCPFYGHICATWRDFQKYLTTQHSDSEYTAPTCESKEDKENSDDDEYTAPAAEGKRAATYDVADKEVSSLIELFGADNDLYEDVIICVPTVDDQQRRYLVENHITMYA